MERYKVEKLEPSGAYYVTDNKINIGDVVTHYNPLNSAKYLSNVLVEDMRGDIVYSGTNVYVNSELKKVILRIPTE